MSSFSDRLVSAWYQSDFNPLLAPLLPLSKLVEWQVRRRQHQYRLNQKSLWQPPVPVIVVGNITVGGTGKTPLVAALVSEFQRRGYRPGIISRGYGAKVDAFPAVVLPNSDPAELGDEPVMLAEMTGVPVVIDPDRPSAARYLLSNHECDVIISDDGLQHYALVRHIEMVVLDGARWLGNGRCLPAGPLREPADRLASVDCIISNGKPVAEVGAVACNIMTLLPTRLVNLKSGRAISLSEWNDFDTPVHAVAGIGNPGRFFDSLRSLGFMVRERAFPDHHAYCSDDFAFAGGQPVIMTAKDAIKCRRFAHDSWWYLAVDAKLPDSFWEQVSNRLSNFSSSFQPVSTNG
ncbi:MAG: tetraacyldisaccharide 4'-kinase [Oceanospirillales bacterium LUC14_002_19_P2]|nr:MAG: tetraacyldisaccharide 4'-kinase [Oceanospirillales bacterium LUC14_002_19_P2]